MFPVHSLKILEEAEDSPFQATGRGLHPPIFGPGGEYFGHEWSRWRYDTLDKHVDSLVEALAPRRIRILDIGCATGERAARFAQGGHTVTATDVLDRSRDIQGRNDALQGLAGSGAARSPITFIHADVQTLAPSDFTQRFDVVHARRMINFVRIDALGDVFRVLGNLMMDDAILCCSFIASGLDDADAMTSLTSPGSRPPVRLCPGMDAHYVGEVHFLLRQHGFRIVHGFTDRQVEAGLIASRL